MIFVQPRRPCYPEPNSLAECVIQELGEQLQIRDPIVFASVQTDAKIMDAWTARVGAEVIRIPDLQDGRMDVGELKSQLGGLFFLNSYTEESCNCIETESQHARLN